MTPVILLVAVALLVASLLSLLADCARFIGAAIALSSAHTNTIHVTGIQWWPMPTAALSTAYIVGYFVT